MWEMWLTATMHPPVAGIFSPSIQSRSAIASMEGFTSDTATLNVQPRFCWSLRTVTAILRGSGFVAVPAGVTGWRCIRSRLLPGWQDQPR